MIQGPFRIDVSDNKNPGRPKNVKVEIKKGAKKAAIKDQERERGRDRMRKRRVYERGILTKVGGQAV